MCKGINQNKTKTELHFFTFFTFAHLSKQIITVDCCTGLNRLNTQLLRMSLLAPTHKESKFPLDNSEITYENAHSLLHEQASDTDMDTEEGAADTENHHELSSEEENCIYFADEFDSKCFGQPGHVVEQCPKPRTISKRGTRKSTDKNLKNGKSRTTLRNYANAPSTACTKSSSKFSKLSSCNTKVSQFNKKHKKLTKQRRYDRLHKIWEREEHTVNPAENAVTRMNSPGPWRRIRFALMRKIRREKWAKDREHFSCPLCPHLHLQSQAAAYLADQSKFAFLHPNFKNYQMKEKNGNSLLIEILPKKNNPKAAARRKAKRASNA